MLFVVPTPIGNLKDITLRSLDILQTVDKIICEDTRRTSLLLNHYQIKKPLLVLNNFNENKLFSKFLEYLKNGENIALVSDAGMPLISDPGYKLVRECLKENIPVDCLPGPSAIEPALVLSSLPPDKFLFLGFLPEKNGHRQKAYQSISEINQLLPLTFIIYISPYKIIKTLTEMEEYFGDITICLAKELSKIHQKAENKKISDWLNTFKKTPAKGEWMMLINLADQM
jgi:16S rRNA (cytidine1402-2'-O)-methyltransferase